METDILVYGHGNYLDILRQRIEDFIQHASSMPFYVPHLFVLFLLGMIAERRGIFRDPAAHRRTLWAAILVGVPLGIAGSLIMHLRPVPPQTLAGGALLVVLFFIGQIGPSALGLAYGAGLLLLLRRARARALLSPLGKVGRMALTNYLSESLINVLLFYGVGLGLYDRLGPAAAAPIFVAIYVAHLLWSGPWLARFHYGPVEWLWRSLTYGKAQPMRIQREAAAREVVAAE